MVENEFEEKRAAPAPPLRLVTEKQASYINGMMHRLNLTYADVPGAERVLSSEMSCCEASDLIDALKELVELRDVLRAVQGYGMTEAAYKIVSTWLMAGLRASELTMPGEN